MLKKYDVKQIENLIGIPITAWPGNCYGIAHACLTAKIVEGRLRYGHYRGYIAKNSLFAGNIGSPFCHHAWIELKDKTIFDPTRWVFEDKNPYIYVSKKKDDYHFGERWIERPAPAYDETAAKKRTLDLDEMHSIFVHDLLHDDRKSNEFTLDQMFWLANESVEILGDFGKAIYEALEKEDMKALVPMDNWDYVMNG